MRTKRTIVGLAVACLVVIPAGGAQASVPVSEVTVGGQEATQGPCTARVASVTVSTFPQSVSYTNSKVDCT